MNPFDLRGPEFLLFYLGLMILALVAGYLWRRTGEGGDKPRLDLSSPYLLACLRAGRKGVLEVMVFSLVDRGLLNANGRQLETADETAAQRVRRPGEEAILRACRSAKTLQQLEGDGVLSDLGAEEEARLRVLRLLPDEGQSRDRHRALAIVLVLLLGTALMKVFIALSRGRTNVGLLIILAVAALFFAWRVMLPLRTSLGNAVFADLTRLFSDLRHRAPYLQAGGGTAEATMIAAIFGVLALPATTFPFLLPFQPPPSSSNSSGCSSSCGSSCGGGCGGGCGGCGS